MRRILRNNGLSIVWLGLFFLTFLIGLSLVGHREYNDERSDHGEAPLTFTEYIRTPHFAEATTENWESEFLQMFLFIALTSFLYQRGSAESKKLEGGEPVDKKRCEYQTGKDAPWPVRRGGFILTLYEYSLSLAFLVLFLACLLLHAASGAREYNQGQSAHGVIEPVSTFQYMATSRFWFESFQNWQSEFLAVGLMVVLSIFLRQKGSPESKPVDAPHSQTGKD